MSTNGVREVEKTLDRISKLPDAVLIQILSLLPTKDAVASCVLSKRWRYLCNSIDNFHFDGCSYYNNVESFVFLVDHVLSHCTCSKIKKIQLILPYNSEWNFDLSISRWMNFAVERKVEDVVLCLCDDNFTFELPISICTCSSLITLDWSCCAIDKESVIQWKLLKSLKLNYVFIDNDDLAKILSGCPALETLELSLFEGFRRLEITSSNLKRLSLGSYWWFYGRADEPLEIIAPYLQHLEISGDLDYLKCKLVNVSSLVTATLTFNITCITEIEGFADEDGCSDYHQGFRNLVLDYLQKLSYATELTIGRWFAEFNDFCCQLELRYLDKGRHIILQSWISNAVFPNLKNVTFDACIYECRKKWFGGGNDKLFELSVFLLKNATALKKFVIVSKRRICRECSESCVSQYLSGLAKKLLDSPRSSKKLLIIYQESALD
ncbi:F-box protein At5g03100-like [Solanum verrucosum]|uniref:F-box protein At5g03100-like n=1 Tax=Solanum verrucosum TaxID=315347 RepID=UPI0020D04536|nr:F-box protein At5g03100-like [Solanum verrucosum]